MGIKNKWHRYFDGGYFMYCRGKTPPMMIIITKVGSEYGVHLYNNWGHEKRLNSARCKLVSEAKKRGLEMLSKYEF